jgi:hypothetical protein
MPMPRLPERPTGQQSEQEERNAGSSRAAEFADHKSMENFYSLFVFHRD